jgi:hypothetical protein
MNTLIHEREEVTKMALFGRKKRLTDYAACAG